MPELEFAITEKPPIQPVEFKQNARPPEPPPAPAAPGAPAKPLTKDEREIEARKNAVLESMGWETETPVETPAEEPPAAPAAPAPAKPKPKVETSAERDARLVSSAAAEAAKLVNQNTPPAPPVQQQAPPSEFAFDPEDAKDFKTMQWLAAQDHSKSDAPAKFEAYCKAFYNYREKWESEHSGQAFNPDDSDHVAFFEKHRSPVDAATLDDARDEMKIEERVNKRFEEKVAPRLAAIDREKAWNEAAPVISKAILKAGEDMVRAVSPELHAILTPDGKADFTQPNLDKLAEHDPVAAEALNRAAMRIVPIVTELEKSAIPALGFTFDNRNPVHAEIIAEVGNIEKYISEAPLTHKVRTQGGKAFATNAEMRSMKQDIQTSNWTPDQKRSAIAAIDSKYWTVGIDDVRQSLMNKIADETNGEIKKFEDLAAKREKAKAPKQAAPAAAPAAPALNRPAAPMRQRPPSLTSQADLVPAPASAGGGSNLPPTAADVFFR